MDKVGGPSSQILMGVSIKGLQFGVLGPAAPGQFGNLACKLVHLEWFETYLMIHRKFWIFTLKLVSSEGI